MITWVIGRGLLGSAIERTAGGERYAATIPWGDSSAAEAALADAARGFAASAGGRPWRVVWAAGAATVASPGDAASLELGSFTAACRALREHLPSGRGSFLVASSAGGVYAGSAGAPFDEATSPRPLSPYGELKLAQEGRATELLADRCPVVLARFSNLYGPGQDLGKLQGLVSRLLMAVLTQQPLPLFVPMDTIRDYLFVDDGAVSALALADEAAGGAPGARVKVVASGQPTTVGHVLHTVSQVTKRRAPIALASHPSAAAQSADLRLRPSAGVWAPTSLPAGIRATYLDLVARLQRRPLATA